MITDQQIQALHRKYARTNADYELIYRHCQVVGAIAMQLLEAKPIEGVDKRLVHVGCMLHDIGAYHVLEDGVFVQGIRHGVIGEDLLRREGLPESVWRIASHHTGVGLSAQDVIDQQLPIPAKNYLAETDEERLVMYADKFHSKNNPPHESPFLCTFEWYRNFVQKFGPTKASEFDALANLFGKPDIEPLSKYFGYEAKAV